MGEDEDIKTCRKTEMGKSSMKKRRRLLLTVKRKVIERLEKGKEIIRNNGSRKDIRASKTGNYKTK